MNRDTARAILAAAALMTVQALLLAALATSTAHSRTVYRCPAQSADTALLYQAHPCTGAPGSQVHVGDGRTEQQQAQARANHARQTDWLDRQPSERSTPSKRRSRRKPPKGPPREQLTAAVPLTSHRIGERPFERLGQQVTPPDKAMYKPKRRKRMSYELVARTPATPDAGRQRGSGVSPSQ